MRGLFRDRFYVFSSVVFLNEKGFLDVVYLCVFMGINILLFGVVDFYLNVSGLRWIRGLDGKEWFVFLWLYILLLGGEILEKDKGILGEVGVDNVFFEVIEKIG